MSVTEQDEWLPTVGKPELIVVTRSGQGSLLAAEDTLRDAAAKWDGRCEPLFRVATEAVAFAEDKESADVAREMSRYYAVNAAVDRWQAIADEMYARDVEAVYVKPAGETPLGPAPAVTPNFLPRQGYLAAAPGGIGATLAWTFPGGDGTGVRIVDLEWNWMPSHEDLAGNPHHLLFGTLFGLPHHGTAVLGVLGGDRNAIGITGICPASPIAVGSFEGMKTADAITQAAMHLGPGDILLLEIHRPGPRFNFTDPPDKRGYIPIEWWPDDFLAIRFAVSRGIIVIEPAGNGAENLDDPLYDTPHPAFPAGWTNPFRRNVDSGAVIVGAGAPPPGTHGRNWGPDRSRLDFSNFGSAVDAQGWGREVTTAGFGDLQNSPDPRRLYTDRFFGTSSAAPIVAGALACVQGARKAAGKPVLTSLDARRALRMTGSPQQLPPGVPIQRIGNRPNLQQLLALP